jgi:SAM-dependent methyltransferase
VVSLVPKKARTVLSIGCGSGATESRLVERGLRVVGIALDTVICTSAAPKGVDIVLGDAATARAALGAERFDCVLYQNVIHLFPDPIEALALFTEVMSPDGVALIQTPNMLQYRAIWRYFRSIKHVRDIKDYKATGLHFCPIGRVQHWCREAGLRITKIVPIHNKHIGSIGRFAPRFAKASQADDFIVVGSN